MSEEDALPPFNKSQFKLKKANIGYMALLVFVGVLSLLLSNMGDKWLGHVIKTSYTEPKGIRFSLVCRTTMVGAVFFVIHALAMLGNKNLSHSCQFIVHILAFLGSTSRSGSSLTGRSMRTGRWVSTSSCRRPQQEVSGGRGGG
jgi:hypothetical protein